MSHTYLRPGISPGTEEPLARWSEGSFRRILVAFDGSEGSWKALRMGVSLAWQHDAELWALSVEEDLPRFPAMVGEVQDEKEREDRDYEELHSRARELAEGRGVHLHSAILPGRAVPTILGYAREGGFDLIVLGGDQHPGVWKALIGTSNRVSRGACCAVMVVR